METPVRGTQPWGSVHVYFFLQGAVEVCSFDVELAQLVVIKGSGGEKSTDGVPTRDGGKGVSEILPWDLSEAFCDKACFEPGDGIIFVVFNVEDPFALDSFTARRDGVNWFVGLFCLKGLKFIMHGDKPFVPIYRFLSLQYRFRIFGFLV